MPNINYTSEIKKIIESYNIQYTNDEITLIHMFKKYKQIIDIVSYQEALNRIFANYHTMFNIKCSMCRDSNDPHDIVGIKIIVSVYIPIIGEILAYVIIKIFDKVLNKCIKTSDDLLGEYEFNIESEFNYYEKEIIDEPTIKHGETDVNISRMGREIALCLENEAYLILKTMND